jgi:hypothetical protein
MKKEIHYCDVCEKQDNSLICYPHLNVIFLTEQTEGRNCDPYLSTENDIEICKDCNNKMLQGNFIYATGAMGYNKYFFKKQLKIKNG